MEKWVGHLSLHPALAQSPWDSWGHFTGHVLLCVRLSSASLSS